MIEKNSPNGRKNNRTTVKAKPECGHVLQLVFAECPDQTLVGEFHAS